MASYNELLALIDAYINQNGVQAITGQVLNGVLRAMVDQLGRGYAIMGAADPTTDPGTPDGPETWFASVPGTYTNFDGIQIVPGELALLSYVPSDGFSKNTIYEGFQTVQATADDNIGYPQVGVSYANGVLSFDFRNIKGEPGENGQDGDPAGFGTVNATVDDQVGTPSVSVSSSGPDTAKNFTFAFRNLKGETGVTSVLATVDNTSGNPQCTVSLQNGQLTLAFTGLKGAQGDTGSSVDYPFTIVNNLTTNDATQALSAAMGVQLESEVSQLEAKVGGLMQAVYDALGPFAWWEDKPDINFNLNSVLVSLNLTNCTSSNNAFCATLGDSYTTTISPYQGRTMTVVRCWMSDEEVTVTNGVISIAEVTGPIVISAAAVGLDDEAYEGMSYRQLFETNNWLEISPGFEDGSFSPMTIGAGTPVITTEEKDSGTYSLKVSSHTGDSQLSQQIRSASTSKKGGYCACRVKVTEYTQGKAGMQFVAADSVNVEGLCDWTTTAFHRTASSSDVRVFLGSFSNGTLTAYIDLPVTVLDDVFNTPPTLAKWTELYETYVAIKKAA